MGTLLLVSTSVVAGCASVVPTSGPSATERVSASPAVSPPEGAVPSDPPATTAPTQPQRTEPVELQVSQTPAFEGDRLTFTVSGPIGQTPSTLRLSAATLDFGDGTAATATRDCTDTVSIEHVYRTSGDFAATVTAASSCDPNTIATAPADLVVAVHLFPAAPAVSASWPVCSTFQLRLASPWSGAGLGNVGTQITLHNVSSRGCTLEGYPDLVLIGRDGRFLPTQSSPAPGGAYMFPAVVPHRVAIAPDGMASFMIGSADNPFGPNADASYDVACPPAKALRVIFPGTHEYGTAVVPIQPCNGSLWVSPIVPGADRIEFS